MCVFYLSPKSKPYRKISDCLFVPTGFYWFLEGLLGFFLQIVLIKLKDTLHIFENKEGWLKNFSKQNRVLWLEPKRTSVDLETNSFSLPAGQIIPVLLKKDLVAVWELFLPFLQSVKQSFPSNFLALWFTRLEYCSFSNTTSPLT